MCTSLLWEHLAVEQPFAGGHWNPQKSTTNPKTKKLQWDGRRGIIMIKSNPIPARWVAHKLEKTIWKELSHCCESSESHIRLLTWGSDKVTESPQGIWPWRPARFDYRTSTGLGETESPVLENITKSCVLQGIWERSSDPTGDWTKITC